MRCTSILNNLVSLTVVVCVTASFILPGRAGDREVVFPIVVDVNVPRGPGGNLFNVFRTVFPILNNGGKVTTVRFTARRDDGRPAPVLFSDDALEETKTEIFFSVPPNGNVTKTTFRPDFIGWASISFDDTATIDSSAEVSYTNILCGIALFYVTPGTVPCYPPSPDSLISGSTYSGVLPARQFRGPVIIGQSERHSAFAIVNPSPLATANVRINVFSSAGELVSDAIVVIPPLNRLSRFLGELSRVPVTDPLGFRGSIKITSDIPIAVAGLHVMLPTSTFVAIPLTSSP